MTPNDIDRTERVRQVIDDILRAQPDEKLRRAGFVHLYGVAQACALLAIKRGLDAELGTIAGMLHDLWSYKTGKRTDHAQRGAPLARCILSDLGCLTESEIVTVCAAIAHHSMKGEVHAAYDELLKDADVLQQYLYNTCFRPTDWEPTDRDMEWSVRLAAMNEELGIG